VKLNKYNSLKKVLYSERGSIAIMMVMSTILILTPIIINFTYDTSINKLKTMNKEDRFKAKLTAESGLKFAMARLRLYQEAYNFLQKNSSAKDMVKQETLDLIWNFPFVYPIPVTEQMNAIQKNAIKEFMKETVLDGQLQLTIENISNKINLNKLRISLLNLAIQENDRINAGKEEPSEAEREENLEYNAETQLFNAVKNAIEKKSETDDNFNAQFYGIEISPLINELRYFISDPESIEDTAGADREFVDKGIVPKRAPLTSFNELYTLPSWPDQILKLIENEFTVHGAIMIDLNKITDKLLKLLIPDITEEDIEEFFKYKNDPDDPKYFNSLDDFKNYIVNIGNIMTEANFTERFTKFASQGLKFGHSPSLFKVLCTATVGRSTFNLTAYVTLPAQPSPRPRPKKEDESKPEENTESEQRDSDEEVPPANNSTNGSTENKEEQKTLLLKPRVVEIIIG
jgi:hypothetical protein